MIEPMQIITHLLCSRLASFNANRSLPWTIQALISNTKHTFKTPESDYNYEDLSEREELQILTVETQKTNTNACS